MKTIIKAALTLCVGICVSCVDLYQEPRSVLTPETIEYNGRNMEALVTGLPKVLWSNNYGFNCRLQSLTLGGDDVVAGQIGSTRTFDIDELHVKSGTDVSNFFSNMYSLIQYCNQIIDGISKSTDTSEEVKRPYEAEAHFYRALAYFYLVRFFGDVPAITDPYTQTDMFGNSPIMRNKTIDVYEQLIIPDLQFAEKYLPDRGRLDNNSTPSIGAAKACLADVYLTMAGWPLKKTEMYAQAAAKAKEVIEKTGHKYTLVSDYSELWKEVNKADDTEHIFAINHSATYDMASQYGISYLCTEEGGWTDYLADSVFFERYPEDTRKEFNFITSIKVGIVKRPWKKLEMRCPPINKYRDYGITSAQSNGITPIYRYAEVLLIYAEAQNRADHGPNDLAYQCLNDVRKRANGGVANDVPAGLDEEGFNQYVFDERGWELFAECKRWFQLVRTERVEEYNKLNPRIWDMGFVENQQRNYILPLPSSQVEMCGWEQNPGY